MVLSLSVMSIAFVAVGSVFLLASHVMPSPGTAEASTVEQSAALSQLIEDLQVARYITEDTGTAITMVVDDRTGDGLPDRLRYAWSGTAGDPLTLSINGSVPVNVADNVQAFSLSFGLGNRVDTVLGSNVVSEEVLLFSRTVATASDTRHLSTSTRGIGQVFTPTLPDSATAYTVTRVSVRARTNGSASGVTNARLYKVTGGVPTGSFLVEHAMNEADLSSSLAWVNLVFDGAPERPAGEATAIALEWESGTNSATVEFDNGGSTGLLTQDGQDDPWINDAGKSMLIEVYGTTTTPTPDVTLTRQVRTGAHVTLQLGSATAHVADTKLYREPGVHSAQWDAGFDASPTLVDMDGDGADWKLYRGAMPGSFADGKWYAGGRLETDAANSFDQPMIVDLVMGATAASRGGANFQINADQAGGLAIPITVRAGRDAAGQHYVNVYDDVSLATARIDTSNLGDNLPAIRLIIAPADNAAAVFVNGAAIGTFTYTPVSASGLAGIASLSEASDGVFDEASIRVGGTAVVTAPAGSTP